jgi:hypothetical protein
MRVETTVASVSWIPSESLTGPMRGVVDAGVSHWDEPPPDRIGGAEELHALCREDRFRFANLLTCWIEVEDGRVVDAGVDPSGGLVMGATTVRLGAVEATFRAAALPVLRREPVIEDGAARFVQTVGGRTALPLPRPVPHPPFVRWQAPLVWTTLEVVLRADGTHEVGLRGASAFPRHWVYDGSGAMRLKSGLTDQARWLAHSFGAHTPWGSGDREALAVAGESQLERLLSAGIMRGRPAVRRLAEGETLLRQGDAGDSLALVLDGVVRVEVAGRGVVGELGPGAVVGERALLEGGRRTATLVAATPIRVAVAEARSVDTARLRELAEAHHREDLLAPPPV